MGNIFNPGSAHYRRVIVVTSAVSCTAVTLHTVFIDFGKQEHVFTPLQTYAHKRFDQYFGTTFDEVEKKLITDGSTTKQAVVPDSSSK